MTRRRWPGTTLALLLLAACGGDTPASRGDSAAAGTSSGSAAPGAPSGADSTPAPSTDVAALTARGLGLLQAGMTIDSARAALAGALEVPAGEDPGGCVYLTWRGAPPGVLVMAEEGRIARIEVNTPGVRTADGAMVGDDEARVQQRYGPRAVVTPHKYEEGHYLTVLDATDTTYALVFETSGGRVTRFRGGRRPPVEYVEGCS